MKQEYFDRALEVIRDLAQNPPVELDRLVEAILEAWDKGGKVISCGNGGSAADSQHFTAELLARFEEETLHKPAVCLTTNASALTAISNDWSYEEVFSRQVKARASSRDVLLGISTSGRSKNVIRALETGISLGASCYGLTGKEGGKLRELDCSTITVPSVQTCHVQEVHTVCLHYVCSRLVEAFN